VKSNNNVSPYRDFYRWNSNNSAVKGPWGQDVWHVGKSGYYYGVFYNGMPDLNYENPVVKDSLFNCAKYWLQTIGVDGFRLDAVKYIFEEGSVLEDSPKTFDFWNEFNTAIKSVSPDAFAVGEAWTSTATVKKYQTKERLDYCFEFDLASNMLNAANNGNAVSLRNHLNVVYEGFPHLQWGSFLTNHDQNRVMDVLGGNIAKAKVAASLLLTIPGIPYLYYGEEIGMYGQKPDEDINAENFSLMF
jgi:glycosidase